jgi:hypothetical protein
MVRVEVAAGLAGVAGLGEKLDAPLQAGAGDPAPVTVQDKFTGEL